MTNQEQWRWKQTLQAIQEVENGRFIDGQSVLRWLSRWGEGAEEDFIPKLHHGKT